MNNSTQRITDLLKQNALLATGVALVVGFFVGWFVMGWWLWPVDFVNGSPAQLRPDLQQDWVRLTAAEYAVSPNIDRAASRISALGSTAPQVISDTIAGSTGDEQLRVVQLQQVLRLSGHLGGNPATGGTGGQPAASGGLLSQYGGLLLG